MADTSNILEHCVLDTFVAKSSNIGLEDLLTPQTASDDAARAVSGLAVRSRSQIFLDETVTALTVLRCPLVDEKAFNDFIQRLHVTQEVFAVGNVPHQHQDPEQTPSQLKDSIDTKIVSDDDQDPAVALGAEDDVDGERGRYLYVCWKSKIHIDRSSVRTIEPSIYCTAAIKLRPARRLSNENPDDDYLESGVATSTNLLAPLQGVAEYRKNPPSLTVARLSKVVPAAALREQGRVLRNATRRYIPLRPAFSSQIRFRRIGSSPSQAKILACLDVQIAPDIHRIQLEHLEVKLLDGTAQPLGTPESLQLPITCRSRDLLSFVYNLLPKPRLGALNASQAFRHAVSVSIRASLQPHDPEDGSDDDLQEDHIPISSAYRTPVDLSSLIYRLPNSLANNTEHANGSSSTSYQPYPQSMTKIYSSYLITLTISGPSTSYLNGPPIQWSLLLVNRSTTRTLNLALIPLTSHSPPSGPSAAPLSARMAHKHKPTLSASFFADKSMSTTDAIENTPNKQEQNPPDLIVLTPDIRLGPLAPGQSATAEMRLLPLRAGVLSMRAIRIVDLDREREKQGAGEKEQVTGDEKETKMSQSAQAARSESKDFAKEVGAEKAKEKVWVDVPSSMLPDFIVEEAAGLNKKEGDREIE